MRFGSIPQLCKLNRLKIEWSLCVSLSFQKLCITKLSKASQKFSRAIYIFRKLCVSLSFRMLCIMKLSKVSQKPLTLPLWYLPKQQNWTETAPQNSVWFEFGLDVRSVRFGAIRKLIGCGLDFFWEKSHWTDVKLYHQFLIIFKNNWPISVSPRWNGQYALYDSFWYLRLLSILISRFWTILNEQHTVSFQ